MSEVYYALIILPMIILSLFIFVFQEDTQDIALQQTIMNCPYPINGGIALTNVTQSNFPPVVNYTVVWDSNSTDYNTSLFHCRANPGPGPDTGSPQVLVETFTAPTDWFSVATGYFFYVSNVIQSFFEKIIAVGNLLYLILFAPAQVTGLAWFAYVEVVLFSFVAIGAFMVIRG